MFKLSTSRHGAGQGDRDIDWPSLIGPVARRLKGEPNRQQSTKSILRWGTSGSFSVDLEKGVWHDHEVKTGGGCVDLIKLHGHDEPVEWLRREGFIDSTSKPTGKANGATHGADQKKKPLHQG